MTKIYVPDEVKPDQTIPNRTEKLKFYELVVYNFICPKRTDGEHHRWPYLTRPLDALSLLPLQAGEGAMTGPEPVSDERQGTSGYLRVPKGTCF